MNPIYGLIGRLNTVPALLAPQGGGALQAALHFAMANPDLTAEMHKHMADVALSYGASYVEQGDDNLPYPLYDGVAIIPIQGTLVNRCGWACSWMTGYDYVQMAVLDAMNNPRVRAIAFDVNTYGGEAQGCFETAALIKSMRGTKPMQSFVNATACSAGYMLACSADEITATPSGRVGSIGVVIMHISYAKMMKDAGIEINFVYAGDHKVDGNPYESLPAAVKADLQLQVDRYYEMFTSAVADSLGVSVENIKATQARTYDAPEALTLGLIHAVEAVPTALAAFVNELSGSQSSEINMTEQEKAAKATADAALALVVPATTVANSAAPAAGAAATPAASADGAAGAAAASNERARIQAITGCEEAKDRTALANHLAFNTNMSADEAKKLLAVSPPAAKTEGNAFAAAMSASEHPNVGAEGGEKPNPAASASADTDRILSAHSQATGVKYK